jgi:hypothetical protein
VVVLEFVALRQRFLEDCVVVDVLVLHGAVVELDEGVEALFGEQSRVPDGGEEALLLLGVALPKVGHVDEQLALGVVAQQLLVPPLALLGHQLHVHLASHRI